MFMSDEEKKHRRSQKLRMILTWGTLGALILLILLLRHEIIETFKNFSNVHIWVLGFVLVWQILNYHYYTALYSQLFEILGKKIRYRELYKVMLELNFVNHVFPSAGVSGFSYFSLRMKGLGVSVGRSTLIQMMRFVTVFLSFQVLLLIGLFALAIMGQVNNVMILVSSSIVTLVLVSTALVAYIVGSRDRIDSFFTQLTKFLNRIIQLVRPKHPETINIKSARALFHELHDNYKLLTKNYDKLKAPFINSFFANFTEIATLYTVYLAFGEPVNFGAIILAYGVANFAGLISVLPGGIGVYEALMTGVLIASGVPAALSIPATIMYRVLTMAIQLPPGYYYYHKTINGKHEWTPQS